MTSKPTLDPANAHPHGKTSEDEIDYGKIILVAIVSLIVFALSTVWAAMILRKESGRITEAGPGSAVAPAEIGRSEIGIVDQIPFEVDQRLSIWRAERAARLNGYGWVDRSKGIAHIPIERAMDAVATGAVPAGAPR
jgi:hypothetical protein